MEAHVNDYNSGALQLQALNWRNTPRKTVLRTLSTDSMLVHLV